MLLKATSIPGFSPTRPFERGCSESCMTSTSKRDAIRRLHALRNLNQLKQTILYSYYYYFARFCPRSINSFPVSSHFIGFSSIKKMNFTSIHASFLLFLIIYKNEKKFSSLFLYSLSGIKAAFLHRKKKRNRSNIYKNIRCIISFFFPFS